MTCSRAHAFARSRPLLTLALLACGSRLAWFALAAILAGRSEVDGGLFTQLCQWDCGWYRNIAVNGYAPVPPAAGPGTENWAFFPLFPLLSQGVGAITGLAPAHAGMVLSNLLFCATAPVIYAAYSRQIGARDAAFLALMTVATPYTLYWSTAYSEATYGFLLALVFMLAHERRWVLAGLAAAALAATRPTGVFGALIIAANGVMHLGWRETLAHTVDLLRLRRPPDAFARLALGFMLAPLGAFLFMLYLHVQVGDGFAFKNVQIAWGRETRFPGLIIAYWLMRTEPLWLHVAAWLTLLGIAAGGLLAWRKRWVEACIVFLTVLIPASQTVLSIHRFAFATFLPYLALALVLPRSNRVRSAVLGAMIALWGFFISNWFGAARWIA